MSGKVYLLEMLLHLTIFLCKDGRREEVQWTHSSQVGSASDPVTFFVKPSFPSSGSPENETLIFTEDEALPKEA